VYLEVVFTVEYTAVGRQVEKGGACHAPWMWMSRDGMWMPYSFNLSILSSIPTTLPY
jgi:hypothetical protein